MPDDEKILRILITAKDRTALSAVLREQELDLACAAPRRLEGGAVSVEAYVPEGRLERLRQYPVKIDVLDDASATARARQKEVGRGNRFAGEDRVPRGRGRKVKEDGRS